MADRTIAAYFQCVFPKDSLRVLPPYEPKDKPNATWVRGYIRNGKYDFIVTGPKLKLQYGGCRWNKMVFAMPGESDPESYTFEQWLTMVAEEVKTQIWSQPEKFKPGAKTNTRFLFEEQVIKPSPDPTLYSAELRCRLSTNRDEKVDADLFVMEGHTKVPIDPCDITAGSSVIPIFRINYFRNIERFGLVLTVVKAQIFPGENVKMSNADFQFDHPM